MSKTRKALDKRSPFAPSVKSMATGTKNNIHVGLTYDLLMSLCFHVSWYNVVITGRTGGQN